MVTKRRTSVLRFIGFATACGPVELSSLENVFMQPASVRGTAADCMNTKQHSGVATDSKIGDKNGLRVMKAAQVNLPYTSAIWPLVSAEKHPHVSVFSDEIHDSVIVDADWLRESAGEENGQEAKVLAAVLNAEPLCSGWREVDILYIHPQ